MEYHPITRKELQRLLPNFDPVLDPQVGEWVLVSPNRRGALLDPLIRLSVEEGLQPIYPFQGNDTLSAASPTETLLGEKFSSTVRIDPSRVFPTLEEVLRRYHRHGMRHREGKNEDDDNIDLDDDDTILYLNPRALLLTPCPPAVFGGSDFIEGLDRETGQVVFVNWRTEEVRTDTAALRPNATPEWAEEILEKAMLELEAWRWRMANTSKSQKDRGAPPLNRV